MFGSESDFDEKSGLLRSGKRYKRTLGSYTLGQNTDYTSLSLEESESEETLLSLHNEDLLPLRTLRSLKVTLARVVLSQVSLPQKVPFLLLPVFPLLLPLLPLLRSTMAHVNDDIKLPVFRGTE